MSDNVLLMGGSGAGETIELVAPLPVIPYQAKTRLELRPAKVDTISSVESEIYERHVFRAGDRAFPIYVPINQNWTDEAIVATLINGYIASMMRDQRATKTSSATSPNGRNGQLCAIDPVEHLIETLKGVRDDLHNENRLNTLSIADVVWHGPGETTVDFIDAALALVGA